MKRFFLVACFLSFMSIATAYAEHFAFKIGENRASFGVGLGWTHGVRNYAGTFNFPSASVLVERSILPFRDFGFLSVGAQFGFHHGHRNVGMPNLANRDFRESWTTFYFVPRLALYFHEVFHPDDFPENIDLFVGVGVGFRHLSQRFTQNVTAIEVARDMNIGFLFGYHFFVGGRYYFRENMAVFAEVGYGLSFLNVGITIRY